MTLIKCSECGQEVSTEASACPHCGAPNTPVVSEQAQGGSSIWSGIGILLIVIVMSIGLYFFTGEMTPSTIAKLTNLEYGSQQAPTPSGHAVPLQEVKNLGYDFYVGQIDDANTVDITDDLKNQITKIVYNAHFPESILKNTPIIILNNLALTGDQYISTPTGNLKVLDLKGDFLSEGGLYATYATNTAVIYINKPIIAQGQLTEVLTHELGHAVGSTLTDQDWRTFYQLRGIPAGTSRNGTNWNLSPNEDFAEVYKNVFTGIAVRTYYGQLTPNIGMDMGACMSVYQNAENSYTPQSQGYPNDPSAFLKILSNLPKIDYVAISAKANADPKVQACRKDVMTNPSKYSSDWAYGVPYKSAIGPATKDFISSIANRLNQNSK